MCTAVVGHGVALPPSLRPLSSVEADTGAESSSAVGSTRLETAGESPVSTEGTIVCSKCVGLIVTFPLGTFHPSMAKLVHETVSRVEISKAVSICHLAVLVLVAESAQLGVVMGLNIGSIEHVIELPNVGSERGHSGCWAGAILRCAWESWRRPAGGLLSSGRH